MEDTRPALPTLGTFLRDSAARLEEAGVPSPGVDARALVQHALGLSRTECLTRAGERLSAQQLARVEALLAQRAARRPLQHLLGAVEWGGLRLRVDGRALIPRPETEWLLTLALGHLGTHPAPRIVDVGTGTGALALALKAACPGAQVTGSDLSAPALALARENGERCGLDVTWVQADLLAGLDGPYDLIVSNPPYLPAGDREGAPPELEHDPALALYAGPTGLDLARPLAQQAASRLAAGGALLLELDPRNAPRLAAELRDTGWVAEVGADLAGRERFVTARRV